MSREDSALADRILGDSDLLLLLGRLGLSMEPCGSQVTCDPPPVENTDWDYRIQVPAVPARLERLQVELLGLAFECESELYELGPGNNFASWRRGATNLLISDDPEWCRRHRAATALCQRLNLLRKPDRVALFQAVLYGNMPSPPYA